MICVQKRLRCLFATLVLVALLPASVPHGHTKSVRLTLN